MDVRKESFARDVTRVVRHLCEVVFNISSDEQLAAMFGITQAQLEQVMQKIINSLPDKVFEKRYPKLAEEIKNICAREFVFFQAQEKCTDPQYEQDLHHFIRIFSRDINERIKHLQQHVPLKGE